MIDPAKLRKGDRVLVEGLVDFGPGSTPTLWLCIESPRDKVTFPACGIEHVAIREILPHRLAVGDRIRVNNATGKIVAMIGAQSWVQWDPGQQCSDGPGSIWNTADLMEYRP